MSGWILKTFIFLGQGQYFSSGNDLANFAPMVVNPTPENIEKLARTSSQYLEKYVAAFIDFPGIFN
jgi:hypothetical protein